MVEESLWSLQLLLLFLGYLAAGWGTASLMRNGLMAAARMATPHDSSLIWRYRVFYAAATVLWPAIGVLFLTGVIVQGIVESARKITGK